MKTLRDILRDVIKRLESASIDEADQDARLLITEAFDLSPMAFALDAHKMLDGDGFEILEVMVKKRCSRMPISQIFGEKEFWSLNFKVTPDTLTPRPDSETLIESALKSIESKEKDCKILDLGTGTGCLLISLLNELPNATGVGVDISNKAIDVAISNAKNLNFINRTEFIESNWFSNLDVNNKFDIIISNPPYIALTERTDLAPEVSDHEPEGALFAGKDGLDDYRLIAENCMPFLNSGGLMILEIGYKQAVDVKKIFTSAGFNEASLFQDLAGRDRCLIFKKGNMT